MLVKMRINKKYHEDEENIEGKTEVQKSKKKGVQPRRESYLSEESDFTEEEDQKNFSLLD